MSISVDEYQQRQGPLKFNLPIQHWSPTSMAMFQRCPRQWQERYIKGRKERPAEALLTGQAVHRALERNFEQKVGSREDLNPAELLDWYSDNFAQIVFDEQEKAGADAVWNTDPESARLRGRRMLSDYHAIVAPRIQPLAVETVISVDLGLAVPIEGRFDVEREESTIDIKTGRQASRKPKEAWRIQAAVYDEAVGKPVEFHSISATEKTQKVTIVTPLEAPDMFVRTSEPEKRELRRTLRALSDQAVYYMTLFGPDEPWPTTGRFHTWACDFCGYRSDCPAWRTE